MAEFAGKYRLGSRLGFGGMAEVYEGTLIGADGFSRPVAIKRMLPALSAQPDFADMFVQEARIAARLTHPGIVSVLDFDRDEDGTFFIVMELVQGTDLRALAETGPIPPPLAAHVASEVLRALHFAHGLDHGGAQLGVIHRDVSPHNVLLSWDGFVKLADFGIARVAEQTRVTRTGVVKGKVGYMSPEQVECQELDGRSDLFAVGILLHEMLTGQRLFGGPDVPDRAVLNRILIGTIPRPDEVRAEVPEALADACLALLARDRDRRPRDAAGALDLLLEAQPIPTSAKNDLAALLRARLPEPEEERTRTDPAPPAGMTAEDAAPTVSRTPRPEARESPMAPASVEQALPSRASASAAGTAPAGHHPALLVLTAVLAVVTLGLTAALALREPAEAGSKAAAPVPPPRPKVEVRPTTPSLITLDVVSDPPGARVRLDEEAEVRGVTPLKLQLEPKSDTRVLRFTKAGFRVLELPVTPDRDRSLRVTLERRRRRARPRRTRPRLSAPPPPASKPVPEPETVEPQPPHIGDEILEPDFANP